MEIRPLREEELGEVAELADGAFIAVIQRLTGTRPGRPFFTVPGLALRLATDPAGCLVAILDGRLVGVLFSVRRGSLAWFGPVAVAEPEQNRGVGQALVAECLRGWSSTGVLLMGLETFSQSPAHVHLYSKLGFRPGWTGVQLRKALARDPGASPVVPAPPLQHPRLPLPELGFLYPGFDPADEVRTTIERGAGRVFASDHGLAILHLQDSLHATPVEAFIPLLAAAGRDSFLSLVEACEEAARAAGKDSIAVRLPGTAITAFEALLARGYRAGGTMLRMKAGANLDYDRDAWYCDDWL
jgi:predicted N-acetyltransferase YhbS